VTKLEKAVIRAAMVRWEEYLLTHQGHIRSAIRACYSEKARALARACARLAAERGKK
jgi:hypothetical protein